MISSQASHSGLYNLNHIHNIYLTTLFLSIILLINVTYPSIYFVKDIGGYLRENSLFNNPVETAFVNGYLFVSDSSDSVVYKIDISGEDAKIKKELKTKDDEDYLLSRPWGLFGLNNTVYIAGRDNGNVFYYKNSPDLKLYNNLLNSPVDIYIDNNTFYALSYEKSRIYVYVDGRFNRTIGCEGQYDLMFNHPLGLYVHNDKIYVADTNNNRIEVIRTNGTMERYIGIGRGGVKLHKPSDVVYYNGYIFVVDTYNDRIVVFDDAGNPVDQYNCSDCPYPEDYESEDETNWTFDRPKGISVINNTIYVADTGNNRVVVLSFSDDYGLSSSKIEFINKTKDKYQKIFIPYTELADNLNIDYDKTYISVYNNAVLLEREEDLLNAYNEYNQLDIKMENILNNIKPEINKKLGFIKYDLNKKVEELSSYYDTSNLTEKLDLCDIELRDNNYIGAYDCFKELGEEINMTGQTNESNMSTNGDFNNTNITEISNLLNSTSARVKNLSLLLINCKYHINIQEYNERLSTAKAYFDAEDYSNAKKLTEELDNETRDVYPFVRTMCEDIDYVLSTINEINSILEQIKYKDPEYYDETKSGINRIQDILYDDPVSAKQSIDIIKKDVLTRVGENVNEINNTVDNTNNSVAAIRLPIFGLVILFIILGIVLYILSIKAKRRLRKNKG